MIREPRSGIFWKLCADFVCSLVDFGLQMGVSELPESIKLNWNPLKNPHTFSSLQKTERKKTERIHFEKIKPKEFFRFFR